VPSPSINRIGQVLTHRYLTLFTRFALGGLFIFAGVAKLGQLQGFVQIVHEYQVLPYYSFVQIYGYVLPPLEVAFGVFLVLGLLLRINSSVSILVLISFVIAKGIIFARGMELPCGCFGEVAVMLGSQTLLLDFFLLAMAFQILFHRGEFFALGPWLKRRRALRVPPP